MRRYTSYLIPRIIRLYLPVSTQHAELLKRKIRVRIAYKRTNSIDKCSRFIRPEVRECGFQSSAGSLPRIKINSITLIYRLRHQLIFHLEGKKSQIIIECVVEMITPGSNLIVYPPFRLNPVADASIGICYFTGCRW